MLMKKPGSIPSNKSPTQADTDETARIHSWYENLVRSNWHQDWTKAIQLRLNSTTDTWARQSLQGILISEFQRQGRGREAMSIIDQQISEWPEDAYTHIRKASHLLYHEEQAELAVVEAEHACRKARTSRQFFFLAHSLKARAATATGRFDIVEHALAEMLNWSTAGDMVDIYPETDFIQRIPEGMISSDLIETYLTQARKLRREWSRKNPIVD